MQADEEVASIAEIYAASRGGQVLKEEVVEHTRSDGTRRHYQTYFQGPRVAGSTRLLECRDRER
jgi:hypothetical protein